MCLFAPSKFSGLNFSTPALRKRSRMPRHGGLLVAPAAPSLIALQHDEEYRRAMADADLAIADSGWMMVFWRLLRSERLNRISGLTYFKRLLERPESRSAGKLFWILPSEKSKTTTLAWSCSSGLPTTAEDCYVAPRYGMSAGIIERGQVK